MSSMFDEMRKRDEHDEKYSEYLKDGGHINVKFTSLNTDSGTTIKVEGEVVATTEEVKALIYSLVNTLVEKRGDSVISTYAELTMEHIIKFGGKL